MIFPSVLEKLSYAGAVAMLYGQGRVSAAQAATAIPDSLLCVLFVMAFFKTRTGAGHSRVWIPNVRIP